MKWFSRFWYVMAVLWVLSALYEASVGHNIQYGTIMFTLCLILAVVTDK